MFSKSKQPADCGFAVYLEAQRSLETRDEALQARQLRGTKEQKVHTVLYPLRVRAQGGMTLQYTTLNLSLQGG